MKKIVLIIDAVCILLTTIFTIDVITYLKKSEDKDIEEIRKYLDKRLTILKILIILLLIISVILSLDSVFNIFQPKV